MNKIWQKGLQKSDKKVEKFTVGNDYILDLQLVQYDCLGSIAHVKMLERIKILNKKESLMLVKILCEIYKLSKADKFQINPEEEDCHTAIENYLTKKLKIVGKKVHTGRSRNDQILTALRLYEKDNILSISEKILIAAEICLNMAKKYEFYPMPGYTHFQRAMPSSVGLLFSAYSESLIDDYNFLMSILHYIDISPLGSAAGYGVNLPIDRYYTSKILGFRNLQLNVIYVQNSRGKFELNILQSLVNLFLTINKICSDILLYTTKEFGFFILPDEYTTGSSIMAQKKNPDIFEILMAKSNILNGYYSEINSIIRNLPSGYHRDFQLIKEPLINSFNTVLESLDIFNEVINKIKINREKCESAMSDEIYSADRANRMVLKGIPFRDAYKKSVVNPAIFNEDPVLNLKSKKHAGGPGMLGISKTLNTIKQLKKKNMVIRKRFLKVIDNLIK